MPVLYKYCGRSGTGILWNSCMFVKNPHEFDDPFEVRPCFDEERKEYFVKHHERFDPHSFISNGSLNKWPVESITDFEDMAHQEYRRYLSSRFRVLCLTANCTNPLMWARYAEQHKGFCVGFDTDMTGWNRGCEQSSEIEYVEDRTGSLLPLWCYETFHTDIDGGLVTSDSQLVKTDGIITTNRDREADLSRRVAQLLLKKHSDWSYEREHRFVYDLKQHGSQLHTVDKKQMAVNLPLSSIVSITLGYDASDDMCADVIEAIKQKGLSPQLLRYASHHPFKYEIVPVEGDIEYIRDVYRIIRPSQRKE